jgi:hypothetical protein
MLLLHRSTHKKTTAYALQEAIASYTANFDGKKAILKAKNKLLWEIFTDI